MTRKKNVDVTSTHEAMLTSFVWYKKHEHDAKENENRFFSRTVFGVLYIYDMSHSSYRLMHDIYRHFDNFVRQKDNHSIIPLLQYFTLLGWAKLMVIWTYWIIYIYIYIYIYHERYHILLIQVICTIAWMKIHLFITVIEHKPCPAAQP